MSRLKDSTSQRKKEHIELCLTDAVAFKEKSSGFEHYEFKHYAITEVERAKINLSCSFFAKKISLPFLISCMTGGTSEAENINARLAEAANELNIPLGVGSQRQALENKNYHGSYKIIRKKAPDIPVLGNIGAAQAAKFKDVSPAKILVDLVEADALVIHVNPLQELLQTEGEPDFKGLLRNIERIVKNIGVPVIIKEVGAGISKEAAQKLLGAGVKGIDVAGAGGTSWAGVELLRKKNASKNIFWDWGLPTSFCLKTVSKLKKEYDFVLIGSGGINNSFDAAKAFALGADITASARIILQKLERSDVDGVVKLIKSWSETLKDIMFLTGSQNISELRNKKIIRKEKLY